jgi:hypothetical protein
MIELLIFAAGFVCGKWPKEIFEAAKSICVKFQKWRADRAAAKAAK